MVDSPLRSVVAAAGLLVLWTAVDGCSYSWLVGLDIELAEDVEVPEQARLVVIETPVGVDEIDLREPDDAPWGIEGGYVATLDEGQRDYRYDGSTCCSPVETSYQWAFLDLNGNAVYDEGEPYGANPDNPVEVSANYETTIVVVNAP